MFQTMSVEVLHDQWMSTRYLPSKKHFVTLHDEIMIIDILQAV